MCTAEPGSHAAVSQSHCWATTNIIFAAIAFLGMGGCYYVSIPMGIVNVRFCPAPYPKHIVTFIRNPYPSRGLLHPPLNPNPSHAAPFITPHTPAIRCSVPHARRTCLVNPNAFTHSLRRTLALPPQQIVASSLIICPCGRTRSKQTVRSFPPLHRVEPPTSPPSAAPHPLHLTPAHLTPHTPPISHTTSPTPAFHTHPHALFVPFASVPAHPV